MLTQVRGARSPFDTALRTERCVLELADGTQISLPVGRWHARADAADELMLDRCTGATLDIGCGPGRLTVALGARGVPVLGVDVSPVAVRLTKRGGGTALQRDVFGRMPGVGRWQHALLADGNIGIGGDPFALLRRVAALLGVGGTALVEVAAPGTGPAAHPGAAGRRGRILVPVGGAGRAVGRRRSAGGSAWCRVGTALIRTAGSSNSPS